MELYILDEFKQLGETLRFQAENENGILYNVEIDIADFKAYLCAEDSDNLDLDDCEGLQVVAQEIYNAFHRGGTSYEVVSVRQKLKAFRFHKQDGGTTTICESHVSNPLHFQKINNYTSYTPIFG